MAENIIIRKAERGDMIQVHTLIKALARFEKLEENCLLTLENLVHDGFDTTPPIFKCIVAELKERIVGYAMYFTSYSSRVGKSTYLEDIFIDPNYRGTGLGKKLFATVAREAQKNSSRRVDLVCLSWNNAMEFYQKIGMKNLTQCEDRHYLGISGEELKTV
ncbi:hypothetical protein FQA39_LY16074 [Lamprigera yunnana]|nr:hypothetical protein FQA39_LY16074 [Lamprigera yunnana]